MGYTNIFQFMIKTDDIMLKLIIPSSLFALGDNFAWGEWVLHISDSELALQLRREAENNLAPQQIGIAKYHH